MDCNKGTKPDEESGKEEIQPVKGLQTLNRQRGIWTGE
jgi:hypothetical protein